MNAPVDPSRTSPLPGTGRLGVASACFTILGGAAAIATAGIAIAILVPHLEIRTTPANPVIALVGALSLTFGCFRTSHLLDRRRSEGIAAAMMLVAAPIAGYATGTPPSLPALGAIAVAIALLASVWRHLVR